MQDAWRAYLGLALGLTEASRKRAQTIAQKLVGQGGATAAQLQALAEELRSTGFANRAALTKIVRFEVDRALGMVGLATADEVTDLTARVQELERALREAKRTAPAVVAPTLSAGAPPSQTLAPAAQQAVAKRVAKKAVAKKATAKKAVAKKVVVRKAAAAKKLPPARQAGTA